MTDLERLADRCEAATGADRRLDTTVAAACGTLPTVAANPHGTPEHGDRWDAPCYTASLDAAMSLVPEGWRWLLREAKPDKMNNGEKGFFARLETHDFKSVTYGKGETWLTDHIAGSEAMCWAATPALALAAAALRATAAHSILGKEPL